MNLTNLLRDKARRGQEGTRAAGRRAGGTRRVAGAGAGEATDSAKGGKGKGDGGKVFVG
jgi:hypothetical protein